MTKGAYQTVLDDKSGYDHILLDELSRTFFGIQWKGWYFVSNTITFGWKLSTWSYHSLGLVALHFFRSIGIPCSLSSDDRHIGELQPLLPEHTCSLPLASLDGSKLTAAQDAIYLVHGLHPISSRLYSWPVKMRPGPSQAHQIPWFYLWQWARGLLSLFPCLGRLYPFKAPCAGAHSPAPRRQVHLVQFSYPRCPLVHQRNEHGHWKSFGHSIDLMALDSNTQTEKNGTPLPHFTLYPTPGSSGVDLFARL